MRPGGRSVCAGRSCPAGVLASGGTGGGANLPARPRRTGQTTRPATGPVPTLIFGPRAPGPEARGPGNQASPLVALGPVLSLDHNRGVRPSCGCFGW
ncbi:hypothetical protein FMEAI12_2300013 [Parafrankia sp. Ea1.12]|nr:hypothetical protein FMEAI12_2300013 [Parafrankia sp. Ea1.12]